MTMNAARLENNIPKNRYRDISPCKYHSVITDCCKILLLSGKCNKMSFYKRKRKMFDKILEDKILSVCVQLNQGLF